MTTLQRGKRPRAKENPGTVRGVTTKSTTSEAIQELLGKKDVARVAFAIKHISVRTHPETLRTLSKNVRYSDLYQADALDRVKMIRNGVPASFVDLVSDAIGFPKEKLFSSLRIPRTTTNRKILTHKLLSPEISERILGLQKLIGQVEIMVRESGNPEGFDAAQWLGRWLEQECPALGNERPIDYLDTLEGQEIVSGVLARMQSGAYA